MDNIDYDVETCSEKYKELIRDGSYGDIIEGNTKEKMIFIYNKKKYIIKFDVDFSYDFENGFNHTYFSNFTCNRVIEYNIQKTFENYIIKNFVTNDRLSC